MRVLINCRIVCISSFDHNIFIINFFLGSLKAMPSNLQEYRREL